MFPFGQMSKGGELSFQFQFQFQGGDPELEEVQVEDPMIYEQDLMVAGESNTITFSGMRAPAAPPRPRRRSAEDDEKKKQHREVERQRRQEMAALFSTLRSLLPLHHVKGKRSTSDHIGESAKYIKQLEGRIKELGDKRDQLRQSTAAAATSSTAIVNNVEVFTSSSAVHVQITCREDAPLLSASLKLLLQAGLDVLSCVTNRLPGGALLHIIHCSHPNTDRHQGWYQIDLKNTLYQLISNFHPKKTTTYL